MSEPDAGDVQTVQPPEPKQRSTKSIVLTIIAALLIFGIGISIGTVSQLRSGSAGCRAGQQAQG
jgi:ABC-type dipeptide/oligopeptide/nickel transport system permease component